MPKELNYKVITIVAGLMKSKLTESQHIDICKPINLLNKDRMGREKSAKNYTFK